MGGASVVLAEFEQKVVDSLLPKPVQWESPYHLDDIWRAVLYLIPKSSLFWQQADWDDIVGDLIYSLFRGRHRVVRKPNPKGLIYTALHHRNSDAKHRKTKLREKGFGVALEIQEKAATEKALRSGRDIMTICEGNEIVVCLLEGLPKKQKRAFLMYALEGNTASDLVPVLGVQDVSAVHPIIKRIKKHVAANARRLGLGPAA